MDPEEYHKALEAIIVKHPVEMASLIQHFGPLPDGESDMERKAYVDMLGHILV